jgi:FixJ family two-component response regulator
MQLVATGMLNKQVGAELGMAERRLKRIAHVMQKLAIASVAAHGRPAKGWNTLSLTWD